MARRRHDSLNYSPLVQRKLGHIMPQFSVAVMTYMDT